MRFRNQTRTTALPEAHLLRIYRTNGASAAPAEATLHRLHIDVINEGEFDDN